MARIIDLSIPIENCSYEPFPAEITYWDHRDGARRLGKALDLPAKAFPGGRALAWESVHMITHMGTHVDSPWHYGPTCEGQPAPTIDQLPLEWFYGDGVRLDLRSKKPEEVISVADLEQALQAIPYKLKPGDIVLLWTGADKYAEDPSYDRIHPGMGKESTLWLVEQGIKVIGTDGYGFDVSFAAMGRRYKEGDTEALWPAHFAGRQKAYSQIEGMGNLEKLPGPTGYKVCVFPVLVARASAGWTRAVAIVED